jgi:DNA-binding PadR family transcriptional regulator
MPGRQPRRRAVSNPLALAVLACLRERPMHPYEMAATMRSYGKERSIKLNFGSLYTVVDNLARHGFIEAGEAQREGRRPERTVYHLTETGVAELEDWMSALIAEPVKEYPQFEAALAELAVLPPSRVAVLLAQRAEALEKLIGAERAELAEAGWLPRLFLVENEYHLAMQEAELAWTRSLLAEFENRTFPDLDAWQRVHDTGEMPPEWGTPPSGSAPAHGKEGTTPN